MVAMSNPNVSLKIVSIPPGSAPQRIREQMVGIIIPLPSEDDLANHVPSRAEMHPLTTRLGNLGGFPVVRTEAVEALKKSYKNEAARFWAAFDTCVFLYLPVDTVEIVS